MIENIIFNSLCMILKFLLYLNSMQNINLYFFFYISTYFLMIILIEMYIKDNMMT